jgi:uncharacterized membrane protein
MRIGTRAFTLRWTWFIAASLLWIVAVYPLCVWEFGRNLQQVSEMNRSQCDPLQSYNGFAYVQCIQAAADSAAAESGAVSKIAALVSIGPVLFIWLIIGLSLFVRTCRAADESSLAPSTFYRKAQRRRWKAP